MVLVRVAGQCRPAQGLVENEDICRRSDVGDFGDFSEVGGRVTGKGQ